MKTLFTALITALLIAGCSNSPTDTNSVPQGTKEMDMYVIVSPGDTERYTPSIINYTLADTTLAITTKTGKVKYGCFDRTVLTFKIERKNITDTLFVHILDTNNIEQNYLVKSAEYFLNGNVIDFKKLNNSGYMYYNFYSRVKLLTIK